MRRSTCVILVMSLAGLSLSCSDNAPTDPSDIERAGAREAASPWERKFIERTSPDGLLEYLETSYSRQIIGMYDEALDEEFRFVFTAQDADDLGLPPDQPWWYKAEDVTSTRNMFNHRSVVNVQIGLPRITEWVPCMAFDSLQAGLCARVDADIWVTVEESGQEPLIFWINNSWLDFMVVEDPVNPDLWTILSIEEIEKVPVRARQLGSGLSATEPMTWGRLKSMYR